MKVIFIGIEINYCIRTCMMFKGCLRGEAHNFNKIDEWLKYNIQGFWGYSVNYLESWNILDSEYHRNI